MRKQFSIRLGLCFLLLSLQLTGDSTATLITSVDHNALPAGETMTFTGSGLSDPTAVSFLGPFPGIAATALNSPTDDTLTLVVPEFGSTSNNIVLIETTSGSTVSIIEAVDDEPFGVIEFSGNGIVEDFGDALIIKAGAVASFDDSRAYRQIFVESGAVLQGLPQFFDGLLFAADGATIDFRDYEFEDFITPGVIYSTGTTILGDLPSTARQVTPLTLSRNIPGFLSAVRVNVTTVGQGAVSTSNGSFFAARGEDFTLTASPAEGFTFTSWSGDETSPSPDLTFRAYLNDVNLTVTFSQGFKLTTFAGSHGTISADPDLACYPGGQNITLTATPSDGYEFIAWGADLTGSTDASTPLTINDNTVVTAVFRQIDSTSATLITSVDQNALPAGETMTFTGSGLSDPTAVSFFGPFPGITATAPTSPTDDTLTLVVPEFGSTSENIVLIETTSGSTVSIIEAIDGEPFGVIEFSGNGIVEDFGDALIIKAGAVAILDDFRAYRQIFVESGAVLQGLPQFFDGLLFAADGATIDFRDYEFEDFPTPGVIYSTGTTILGDLPSNARQVTPLTLSRNIPGFTSAARINVTTVGQGTVSTSNGSFFAASGEDFTLTASPAEGFTFTSWSGDETSSSPELTFRARRDDINLTVTFSQGFKLTTFAGSHGTISVDSDLACYPSGQNITLTATPSDGYEFIAWGADLTGSTDASTPLTINDNTVVTAVFRQIDSTLATLITSVDHNALPAGETMTFTGSGLSDPTAVSFFGPFPGITATALNSPTDDTLTLVVPEFGSTSENIVLIETSSGSTVSIIEAIDGEPFGVIEFSGNGIVEDFGDALIIKAGAVAILDDFRAYRQIFVESGAVLQGLPQFFDGLLFAADGATIDFRDYEFEDFPTPGVIYSTGTTILGDLPSTARQVTPLTLSRNIPGFITGCSLSFITDGDGTVVVEPEQDFYAPGSTVQVTAVPDEGSFFIRWVGLLTTRSATQTLRIPYSANCELTARFSDRPDFFSDWRTRYFTQEELADPNISGLDADPDRDGFTNAAEYAFGSDPSRAQSRRGIRIQMANNDDSSLLIYYIRPVNAVDITYQLRASTFLDNWQDGSTGDLIFSFLEEEITPRNEETENVTLRVTFPDGLPETSYFQLDANIEDIN